MSAFFQVLHFGQNSLNKSKIYLNLAPLRTMKTISPPLRTMKTISPPSKLWRQSPLQRARQKIYHSASFQDQGCSLVQKEQYNINNCLWRSKHKLTYRVLMLGPEAASAIAGLEGGRGGRRAGGEGIRSLAGLVFWGGGDAVTGRDDSEDFGESDLGSDTMSSRVGKSAIYTGVNNCGNEKYKSGRFSPNPTTTLMIILAIESMLIQK